MLKHQLYNPIKRAGKEIEFAKYVEIHKQQLAPTDSELVEFIKNGFYDTHTFVDQEKLDKIWEFMAPKIKENAGLAEFIKDNNGQLSEYFFPWVINVFRSPATALEMSYGAGPHLDGAWCEDISDTDDPLSPFIKDDPAFVYNRERQLFIADLVYTVQDIALDLDTTARIVDFGAGTLAWARRHGFSPSPNLANIYAFDRDPSIKPEEIFDEELQDLGIQYKYGDFTAQLNNPDCKDANLIILGGVASYIPPETFETKIVPAMHELLYYGGELFFDLQLDCPCYRHSMDILGWPEFNLPTKTSEAIDHVETMRRNLWSNGIKFSAEYQVDTFNRIPSSVMVTMQKVD